MRTAARACGAARAVALAVLALAGGCQTARHGAAEAYYEHRYPMARDLARPHAADRRSPDVVLDSMRLGLASLADGDLDEAERSLLRAYEYLTSGGVNAPDRTVTSTLIYEEVRVWKGEPYEQAMSFYYLSALYMLRGDWENARAAASNALFALRDFSAGDRTPDMHELVREAEEAERLGQGDYFEQSYRRVESQFALGYLMAATAYVLMGQPEDGRRMFQHVRELREDLAPLADALEDGRYNTLLLVDLGRGPRKVAYGPDDALVRFEPDGRDMPVPLLSVSVDGRPLAHVGQRPVVDLWRLSQEPKWWSLEPMRHAKSAIGDALLYGGLAAAVIGGSTRHEYRRGRVRHETLSPELALAGLGMIATGALLKGSARADTRHLAMLPRCVYLIPLELPPGLHELHLHFKGEAGSDGTWHDLTGGREDEPAVYYLRMHNAGGRGMPPWSPTPLYSTDVYAYRPGDRPWIMGGRDLTPPSERLIDAYHAHGVLTDMSLADLLEVYRAEGILLRPGPQGRADEAALDPELYRHIADGGRVLHRPRPGSHQHERVTRLEHRPYEPRSALLRRIISRYGPAGGEPAAGPEPMTDGRRP